jgi:hypothetical protein
MNYCLLNDNRILLLQDKINVETMMYDICCGEA